MSYRTASGIQIGLAGGLVPGSLDDFDEACAAAIARLGFSALTVHFGSGDGAMPSDLDAEACARARSCAERHGLQIVHSWGFGANLVHPDPHERRRQRHRLVEAIEVASRLGAVGVITGAGSANPRGGYRPHPENHSDEAETALVESLAELAPVAEGSGVSIVLESHAVTVLDAPERTRRVIERVGSDAIRANLDPVNFVRSLDDLYRSSEIVKRALEMLADVAVSGHVKDACARDGFVLHIDEVPLGQGSFDATSFVEGFIALLPDKPLFIEHLPAERVADAKRALDAIVAGVTRPPELP
jgi:sugar phosphate isomerase/epimerase